MICLRLGRMLMNMRKIWFNSGFKLLGSIVAVALSSSAMALYVEEFGIGNWSNAILFEINAFRS